MRYRGNHYLLFIILWLVLFFLYLPATHAGFVADFTGWLNDIRTSGFWDYINRTHFSVKSLYQFTQFTTYIFYRLFGIHALYWHLLHISLQAINSFLWFLLCSRIFSDSNIKNANLVAFAGTLIFCVNPYLSEVIVWEPSFHYLQGFLLILLILLWVQKFHYSSHIKYAWFSGIVFFLSTYSLEIFYLTPFFVCTLALYYRLALHYDKTLLKKTLLWFLLPQLILCALYLVVYHITYGEWMPHLKDTALHNSWRYYLSKPAKYIFFLLFSGRFFSADIKQKVYDVCQSYLGIFIILFALFATSVYIAFRFKSFKPRAKTISLLFIWILPVLIIMGPLWFPESEQYIFCDRYLYLLSAIIYMLTCLILYTLVNRYVFIVLVALYVLMNVYITSKLNKFWKQSADIVHTLLYDLPNANNKKVLLLDLPENYKGIYMIDATAEGEYKLMHNELVPEKIKNVVYDVVSFNMNSIHDGAHVLVLNDTTIHVTLNQSGSWWWYHAHGAVDYENEDYAVHIIKAGRDYILSLKKPADNYLLLYMADGQWKTVDLNNKKTEQL